MREVKLLRALFATEIVLTIAAVVAEFLLEGLLPEQLRAYLAAEQEAPLRASEVLVLGLGLPLLVATVVAWIGLLRFWKHAPPLYLGTWAGAIILLLVAGPAVHTAVAEAVDTAAAVVGGVILGMVYLSDLRDRFGRSGAQVHVEGAA